MIISLIKRQKGENFIQNLENQYKSIENLEKITGKRVKNKFIYMFYGNDIEEL